ncbi:PLP-dependent aminotransferase family protein [Clostridium botulinum]|uniref:PLP-dependent aminotransferase family protein n=1 Tax=Clostridium botulinum TaxID=1491 RepID=A0A846JEJ5_CLOBO|nr:PLP-dependent aminotransferase family protein [Clostridium botulinum]ACA57180.1 transcriptional regulator, GntR family/aminotransferase, classes I and II [Clostridium botulinum A3 str. Loch Maree]NFH64770.1 PLP-dependent aminotransferase family protein [Clostridium botulinum]NFJ08584.1 PLP-dependent aminotransferase family protein [Clostridium botulinum]NFK14980.1 PLP-dependent aminotransferase family protein [Clostridium botulinum]NFM92924.1 PLP-dependent aminotransferase family protein [C
MYKYLEILNHVESLIQEGEYKDGDKLPSIRDFTKIYSCNKSTIIKALEALERQHRIYSIPKSGYYVVKRKNPANSNKEVLLDFASSAPDPQVFPYLDFQHCINEAIDIYKNELFIYGTPKGLPSLIDVIQKHLADYQVFTNRDNIFITSGVQQALAILTTLTFPNKKETILIEQPSYHLFIDYLETHNVPVLGIKRTDKGIDLNELERLFKTESIKFFYTMPRFHNPLGTSYSQREKKAIVKLAEKYDVFIVEDDYLADLEEDPKADPLYAYGDFSHVIYLKSYSKIIFPGLRIGVAVIPNTILESFGKYKRLIDVDSPMLSQGALEIYIKSGMFQRHKQKIRTSYSLRSKCLASILQKQYKFYNNVFQYNPIKNPCIHTYITFSGKINREILIDRLKKKSIIVATERGHYLSTFSREKILKLNVTNVREDYIEKGFLDIIQEIIKIS